MPLGAERLRELLDYDRATGVFRWRVQRQRVRAGAVAGHVHVAAEGHVVVTVEGRSYGAHRLAWLWMTGAWPRGYVDHRDRNPANNCWSNLREATHGQNRANSKQERELPKGVYVSKRHKANPYEAGISANGRRFYLGRFSTIEGAHAAYSEAARKHFGEFANPGNSDN